MDGDGSRVRAAGGIATGGAARRRLTAPAPGEPTGPPPYEPPVTPREILGARGRAVLWVGLYLVATLSPLAVMAVRAPEGRSFWTELSVAAGFVGMAMLAVQFLITARFRRISAPYGIDVILRMHREVSLLAVVLLVAHPIVLFIERPETRSLLNPVEAPWRARMAVAALLLLVVIVVSSLWRQRLRLGYETWRLVHGILAVGVLALALGHALGVGHYLDLPWKRALWLVLVGLVVASILWTRVVKPALMWRRPWRVSEVRRERGDSWTLVLEPEGHRGMRFRAGQFAWLTVGDSPYGLREHPFSFSSSARHPERVEMTIKEAGDFTTTVGEIAPGTRAYLDGPRGVFIRERHGWASGYVLIAGGIGVTPIMSILRSLADEGDRRPHVLVYAVSDLEAATFREEIEELAGRLDLRVVMVPQEAPEGWDGPSGFVDREILQEAVGEPRGRRFFICGPPPMMEAARGALLEMGVPAAGIEMEQFELV
ncbi:MAG TPA: ferric reductase-like transmembrane domain-containing protein [Miltoncostaeaceae bacterium]|nr:ferric reductase-like transmembrane domain-containing protein [Miltoncostaeaceae bacterium]